MKLIVAQGVWCAACEYFEVPDIAGGLCLACGCPEADHSDAEVVVTE